ncbi:DUF5050 domain-containing protein [Clostridium sp. Mt-5]|uniref:DUF5050 domain-containing protein n=1 Tax=Clostridium moutaii TaxID=3240932 RepID=A0ABV4BJ17_9CLOT
MKQLTTKELDFTGNIINGALVSYNNGNTYYYNPQDDTYHQLSADNTTDGTREEHVDLNIKDPYIVDHGYPFCIKDGRIYMSITEISASPPNKPEFIMANLDGSDIKIIKEDNLSRFQPVDNWIYYSDSNGIHKIKNDGSEDTLLTTFHYTNNEMYSINVFNDYIYYTLTSFNEEGKSNDGLYRMNLDGSNIIKISDKATDYLFAVPGWIYFYKNSQVLKVKIDA